MRPDAKRTATIICRERAEVLIVNRETVMEHCPDVFQQDFDEKFNVLRYPWCFANLVITCDCHRCELLKKIILLVKTALSRTR